MKNEMKTKRAILNALLRPIQLYRETISNNLLYLSNSNLRCPPGLHE
jgi:hypothetical protein